MQKFQCLLFVLKRSYICYYIICMTVTLKYHVSVDPRAEKFDIVSNDQGRTQKCNFLFLTRNTILGQTYSQNPKLFKMKFVT